MFKLSFNMATQNTKQTLTFLVQLLMWHQKLLFAAGAEMKTPIR